jgi:Fe2+ or Zn2+ uptake regulation protein
MKMTKANVLMSQINEVQVGSGRKEILALLNESEEEVFSREEIKKKFPSYKPLTVGQYLEDLRRKGKIESVKFRGRAYYGNPKIIAKIKARLEEAVSSNENKK